MVYNTGMLFCHLTFITHRSNKVGFLRVIDLNISIICSKKKFDLSIIFYDSKIFFKNLQNHKYPPWSEVPVDND